MTFVALEFIFIVFILNTLRFNGFCIVCIWFNCVKNELPDKEQILFVNTVKEKSHRSRTDMGAGDGFVLYGDTFAFKSAVS